VIIAVFLVGAATGGVLFGWLGDKLGRVKAMTLAIFTYAIFTGLCAFVTEAWQFAGLRFIASLGMGGEWALGVALVNEIWAGKNRAWIAGMIGAASNIGFLLTGVLSLYLNASLGNSLPGWISSVGLSQRTADYLLHNRGWRFLAVSGALPALINFFILIFVPESHKWEAEKKSGSTSHWATIDLLGVLIACSGGSGHHRGVDAASARQSGQRRCAASDLRGPGYRPVGLFAPVRRYMTRAQAAAACRRRACSHHA
jgi:SHS family sialic acid transporter-like MFS transporter